MKKIKDDLMSFVKSISNENCKSILDAITELRLEFIFEEELPLCQTKLVVLGQRLHQERMNHLYLNELQKIYELCGSTKVIVFKGISLAFPLYCKSFCRFFNDMDLFVKADEVENISKILENLGYAKEINNENNRSLFYIGDLYADYALNKNDYIDEYTKNHQIFKRIVNGTEVKIELHSFLFSPIKYPYVNCEVIYSRCKKILIENQWIYTLSTEDTLICSICHLCKHISSAIMNPNAMHNHIDMKSIIDIKLIIEQRDFLWENIILTAKDWGILGDLLLVLKLINYVFPCTIDDMVIEHISKAVLSIGEKKSHASLINGISLLEAKDIFNFNLASFFHQKTIDKSAPCYSVSRKVEDSERIELKYKDNLFVLKPYWSKEYLKIILQPNHDMRCIENVIYIITVGSEISYLYAQTFFLDKSGNEIQLSSSYGENSPEKFSASALDAIEYNISNNGLIIKIPWNRLGIRPQFGDVLPFNCKVIVFDNYKKLERFYSLTKHNYYNDYGTHSIILKK